MNLTLVPLLIVALLLATTESDVETAELVLSGQHQIEDHRGALIIGDAEVSIPVAADVPGPIYVIGGEVNIAGTVDTDVIQLAGTVTIEPEAVIGDELRHIGGTSSVSPDSDVGRTTSLDVTSSAGNPTATVLSTAFIALVLAWVGSSIARRRPRLLDNVTGAATLHPVVSVTVGALASLTAVALFVFMAFTLVLIPVAIIGFLAGSLTLGYAVVAWGHLLGRRLPVRRQRQATGLGIVAVTVALQLVSGVPLLGDLIVLGTLLTGVGAILITYYGLSEFQPEALED